MLKENVRSKTILRSHNYDRPTPIMFKQQIINHLLGFEEDNNEMMSMTKCREERFIFSARGHNFKM